MMSVDMRMDLACRLHTLATHGRDFLVSEEFNACKDRLLKGYYNFLAVSVMRGRRAKKFWDFHKGKLNETVGFSRSRFAGAIVTRLCRALLNPYETFEKLQGRRNRSGVKPDDQIAVVEAPRPDGSALARR